MTSTHFALHSGPVGLPHDGIPLLERPIGERMK